MDLVFQDSLYWLFMNNSMVKFTVGFITFLTVVVSLLLIFRKWSDV